MRLCVCECLEEREEVSSHTHVSWRCVLGLWRLTSGGTKAISEIKATRYEKEKPIIHILV